VRFPLFPSVDARIALVLPCGAVAEKGPGQKLPPVAPFLGTDRLGRPLTNEERRELETLLRTRGFAGARRRALLFGRRLTRSFTAAEDLVQKACLRLVRWGWDPNVVSLEKRLCRLVWSEWTHETAEDVKRRNAEERFLAEMAVHEGTAARSTEDYAARLEEEQAQEQHAKDQIERLRKAFAEKGDSVNLYWLERTLAGETDLGKMARESGRDVKELYSAKARRDRIVAALVAEDNQKKQDPGEKPR
jgi:hypothetical protein